MSKLETNTIDTVSGTSNLTIGGANNTGSTTIKTNNTDAVTIDNSQRVGIGTTSPSNVLDIVSSTQYKGLEISNGSNIIAELVGFGTGNDAAGLKLRNGGTATVELQASGNSFINGGDVLIGTTSFSSGSRGKQFEINTNAVSFRSGSATTSLTFHNEFHNPNGAVGSIRTSGTSTSYVTSSDYRLKENVSYDFDATTRLKQLKPARFNFIADANTTVDGFLAHEVQDIVPEAISGEKDAVNEDGSINPQGIDQAKLVPLLVKTIQELEARITELENK